MLYILWDVLLWWLWCIVSCLICVLCMLLVGLGLVLGGGLILCICCYLLIVGCVWWLRVFVYTVFTDCLVLLWLWL